MSERFFGKAPVRNLSGVVKKVTGAITAPVTNSEHLGGDGSAIGGIFLDLNVAVQPDTIEVLRAQDTGIPDGVLVGCLEYTVSFTYLPQYATGGMPEADAKTVALYPGEQVVFNTATGGDMSGLLGLKASADAIGSVFLVTSASESGSINGNRTLSVTAQQWAGTGMTEVP